MSLPPPRASAGVFFASYENLRKEFSLDIWPEALTLGVIIGAGKHPTPLQEIGKAYASGEAIKPPPCSISHVGGKLYHFRGHWNFSPWAQSIVIKARGGAGMLSPSPNQVQSASGQSSGGLCEWPVRLFQSAKEVPFHWKFSGRVPFIFLIQCGKSRLLTVLWVRILLLRGAITASIDLSDASFHILVAERSYPFLGFRLGEQAYPFRFVPSSMQLQSLCQFEQYRSSTAPVLGGYASCISSCLAHLGTQRRELPEGAGHYNRFLESLGF